MTDLEKRIAAIEASLKGELTFKQLVGRSIATYITLHNLTKETSGLKDRMEVAEDCIIKNGDRIMEKLFPVLRSFMQTVKKFDDDYNQVEYHKALDGLLSSLSASSASHDYDPDCYCEKCSKIFKEKDTPEPKKCKGCKSTYMPYYYKGYCCKECYDEYETKETAHGSFKQIKDIVNQPKEPSDSQIINEINAYIDNLRHEDIDPSIAQCIKDLIEENYVKKSELESENTHKCSRCGQLVWFGDTFIRKDELQKFYDYWNEEMKTDMREEFKDFIEKELGDEK